MFRNLRSGYAGPEYPPLDVLLDEEGQFLAAFYGESAFATVQNPEIYNEVLGYLTIPPGEVHYEAPKELLGKVVSTKLKPFPLDDPQMRSWVVSMTGRGDAIKFGIWFYAEVQFEGEDQPRNVMVCTWNKGTVDEQTTKLLMPARSPAEAAATAAAAAAATENDFNFIPYESPALAGANRYAATVGIRVATTPGQAGITRYVTEAWAGLSPWKDKELDPNYGELLPDELLTPMDKTSIMRSTPMGSADGKGLNPPIKPEVKARLEREAAEKAAAKNK